MSFSYYASAVVYCRNVFKELKRLQKELESKGTNLGSVQRHSSEAFNSRCAEGLVPLYNALSSINLPIF